MSPTLPPRPARQLLVIAHRGASGSYPEHTAGAYRQAIAEGADGLECDVRLTADGVVVCMHDRRIDRTSDGTGVLSAKTYSELARRDYASWKRAAADGAWPPEAEEDIPESATGLLRLDQLVDIALAADRPLQLSIETKHPVRFGGLVEDRVIALLRRRELLAESSPIQVNMMSFSETALRRVRELEPALPTVLLMDRVPVRSRSGWLPAGARVAGLDVAILRTEPEYVELFHSAGSGVFSWVVDTAADIDLCMGLGVEAIITNRPAQTRAQIERGQKKVRTLPTGDAAASEHP